MLVPNKVSRATLVPKEGIEFTTIPVQGLQRQLSLGTLVTLGKTALGIVKLML